MIVEISEFEKKYSFELRPVTQLCGQNIIIKTYMMESMKKYFSTFKYSEEKNKWRDNVRVDGQLLGRKHYRVLCVQNSSDLISMIKWSKQSLMLEYVKILMQKFDWQCHLNVISDEMDAMFQMLNEDLESLGDIELNYEEAELWNIIQKSSVTGINGEVLEDKSGDELMLIFLNLIEQILSVSPEKILVIIENPDHYLSISQYRKLVERMQKMSSHFDLYFINLISLDGYAVCQEELCPGIAIFNEVPFQMPEMEELLQAINDNYPCNKSFTEKDMQELMESIIQKIGKADYLNTVEENVICKIINQSLLLNDRWEKLENMPEISFLRA